MPANDAQNERRVELTNEMFHLLCERLHSVTLLHLNTMRMLCIPIPSPEFIHNETLGTLKNVTNNALDARGHLSYR